MMNKLSISNFVSRSTGHPNKASAVSIYANRVSLNTTYGCILSCRYCVLTQDKITADPFRVMSIATPQAVVAEYFRALDDTPGIAKLNISIGDHSDPLLRPKDTLAVLQALADRGVRTPVLITTKLRPSAATVEKIAALNLKISVFISIADTNTKNTRVELNNVNNRLAALHDFKNCGIHTVLYIKPWASQWTSPETIGDIIKRHKSSMDAVVLSPLSGDASDYDNAGIKITQPEQYGSLIEDNIISAIYAASPDLFIARKRSCAVNKHWSLRCRPPLFFFETQNASSRGNLFHHAVADANGYCRVFPKQSFLNIEPGVIAALAKLTAIFKQANTPWALIGSFQRAISNTNPRVPIIYHDIDIGLIKSDLIKIISQLQSLDMNMIPLMSCKGECSRRGAFQDDNWKIKVKQLGTRLICHLQINGIRFDLTSAAESVIQFCRKIHVAGLTLPLAEAATTTEEC